MSVRENAVANDQPSNQKVVRHRWSWLMLCGQLLWAMPSFAQVPPAAPSLVSGSSDTIHDAMGIAIGMTCDQARTVASKVSAQKGILNSAAMAGTVRRKGERNGITYKFHRYEVPLNLIRGGIVTDMLRYSCLDAGRSEVFEITRSIRFGAYDVGDAPPMASLRAMFQEKYGVPTVIFSPYSFATLFNRTGVVTAKDACGTYNNGALYLQDFGTVDPDRCSYALTFVGQPLEARPGSVGSLIITIRDYLRLQNDADGAEMDQAKQTPMATPKL